MAEENEKDKGGRPALFETPEQLQEMIDKYFSEGIKKRTFIVGSGLNKQSIEVEIPTITGLCYYLGFESRQSFYDYEKKTGFTYTIKKARLKIERMYEEQLQYGNSTGAIFALKNMDWKDKSEIDHSTLGKPMQQSTQLDYSKLSDAALREIANALRPEESKD